MKKEKLDISLSKHLGIDVGVQDAIEAELPYLQWELIYITKRGDSEKEYILYNANDEPSKEEYANTNLCPGEIDEINLMDDNLVEVDDPESWADEKIDWLLKKKPLLVRAILKERILGQNSIEENPEQKRSFGWSRSLAEVVHILEKENSLPKGSLVFRKKGKMMNLRTKLARLYDKT